MCGIAGIIHYGISDGVPEPVLRDMNDALSHRGPDGEGTWLSDDRRVGLAHRRLSIIDLTAEANQPMRNEDGSVWITFNGEIYNHLELRRELTAAGHTFATDHADTEVLIHGYEEWGIERLLGRLQGMFAFAIWDENAKRMTLARDRVGIKPVYFTKAGGRFLFASEIKSLVRHPAVTSELSGTALYHYLSYLTPPAPLTMFRGIYKLPAAHYLEVADGGTMRAVRYWDAVPRGGSDGGEDYEAGVLDRLERSVERRMMSDVPFGAFLSGGMDSSVNTALMSRHTAEPVKTFSVGFSDHRHLNELDYARRVADHLGTEHHEVLVNESDMTGYLAQLVRDQDEPLADWVCIPLHFVSKLARENGVKVVQVGEGSDEQFCGYRSYMMYLRLHQKYFGAFRKFLPGSMQRGVAAGARAVAGMFPDFEIYADAVGRAARGGEAFWSGAVAYWESQKAPLMNGADPAEPEDFEELIGMGLLPPRFRARDSEQVALAYLNGFDERFPESDQLMRMIHNEFRLRLPELLLMRVDKITMASSLEGRVPFLDHELVDYTMGIPMDAKIKGGEAKALLKSAVRGIIPDEIIDRPKMGFSAPMAEWLRGDFGRQAEAQITASSLLDAAGLNKAHVRNLISDHRSGRRDAALLVWVLYNAAAWFDHWVDGGE